jgi:hypothetical protein
LLCDVCEVCEAGDISKTKTPGTIRGEKFAQMKSAVMLSTPEVERLRNARRAEVG